MPPVAPHAPTACTLSPGWVNDVVRIESADHHRCAHPLDQTRADQRPFASREAAGQRRRGEQQRSRDQYSTAPGQVGRAAAEEHEPSVGEQVSAEHPLQALDGEVQAVADGREGDVDNRGVHEVEEGDAAQEGERHLAAARGEERRLRGGWGYGIGHAGLRVSGISAKVSWLTYQSPLSRPTDEADDADGRTRRTRRTKRTRRTRRTTPGYHQ